MHEQAASNNGKPETLSSISDPSSSVLVPVISESPHTSNDRETGLDSLSFSADELWPTLPRDWLEHEDSDSQLPDREGASILDTLPDPLSAADERKLSRKIHVLGMGVTGKFIAHGLASLPNPPPITLLMQRPLLMQQWHDEGAAITLVRNGYPDTRIDFNIESAAKIHRVKPNQRFAAFGPNMEHSVEAPSTVIDSLIVTTASKVIVPALMAVRHRLRPSSTVCIIHDGLGIIEDLNTLVFPDPQRRPTYVLCSMVYPQRLSATDRTFTIVQRDDVGIVCSKLPRTFVTEATEDKPAITRYDLSWPLQTAYLVGSLARVPEFHTKTVGHKNFYKLQLLHVAIHSVIGPVSVLHDCSNGQLLSSHNARLAMRSVLEEVLLIIRSLPEIQSLPNLDRDFSIRRVMAEIKHTLRKTADSSSVMLRNVKAGTRTEIDSYNGYLVVRAAQLGIDSPRNEMLVNVVKGKQLMRRQAVEAQIPFVGE